MRKILKNILSHGIVFVVSGIIFTIVGVYAATTISSAQVKYNSTTVDAALNDLYTKASKCENYIDPALINESLQSNTIYLTVVGFGNKKILGDDFNSFDLIDTITVNGSVQETIGPTINSLDATSDVVIKFRNDSNITSLNDMFNGCSSITSIKFRMNTTNVVYMYNMFYGCSSLTSIDFGFFNTSNVKLMNSMFYGCSSLSNLNLSTFDTSNIINMNSMFEGHASGLQIKAPSSVCSMIASSSGISGSYTCTQ